MPKDEWGVKRLCPSCETRFYDLQQNPMTCPNCGAEFDLESLLNKKSSTRPDKRDADSAPTAKTDDDVDAVVIDDDDDSDDSDLGDELLDDDEDETVDLEEIADVASDDDDD
ncbi:TIGR02300 family protein [Oceanibium sediminis]|uniref:TIGR02300 family protein n=1 Tax=Oceanibium sediminis TaxID=2026339 RepID=UPI000DD3FEE9|nr:TIGR02300 family protein [Oceanibium sediminis]